VDAFARPVPNSGDLGNASRTLIQKPPLSSLNASLFKNFVLSGHRRLQFRVEGYNVLNHTQLTDIGTTFTYNAAGQLTNRASIGMAAGNARPPRIFQASVRLNF
jgi:hypothetical protein